MHNLPPAIRTYLSKNPIEDKKVGILMTYGGSGTEKVEAEIKVLLPKANFVGKLGIKQREMSDAENKIKEWAKTLNP